MVLIKLSLAGVLIGLLVVIYGLLKMPSSKPFYKLFMVIGGGLLGVMLIGILQ